MPFNGRLGPWGMCIVPAEVAIASCDEYGTRSGCACCSSATAWGEEITSSLYGSMWIDRPQHREDFDVATSTSAILSVSEFACPCYATGTTWYDIPHRLLRSVPEKRQVSLLDMPTAITLSLTLTLTLSNPLINHFSSPPCKRFIQRPPRHPRPTAIDPTGIEQFRRVPS